MGAQGTGRLALSLLFHFHVKPGQDLAEVNGVPSPTWRVSPSLFYTAGAFLPQRPSPGPDQVEYRHIHIPSLISSALTYFKTPESLSLRKNQVSSRAFPSYFASKSNRSIWDIQASATRVASWFFDLEQILPFTSMSVMPSYLSWFGTFLILAVKVLYHRQLFTVRQTISKQKLKEDQEYTSVESTLLA